MLLGKAGRAVCQGANASLTGSGSKQSLRTGGKTQQWETNKQTHLQDGVQLETAVAVLIETGKGAPRALQPELPAGGSTRSSFINTCFCRGFLSKQKYMCSAHFSPAPCRGQHVHSSINISFLSTILYQSKCMCTQTHVHTHTHIQTPTCTHLLLCCSVVQSSWLATNSCGCTVPSVFMSSSLIRMATSDGSRSYPSACRPLDSASARGRWGFVCVWGDLYACKG